LAEAAADPATARPSAARRRLAWLGLLLGALAGGLGLIAGLWLDGRLG
jgi:ferric-dicitrate binding protein FerR (iron transport regulator)